MSYSTPGLLTDESRWLAKQARLMSMIVHRENASIMSIITVSDNYDISTSDYTVLVDTTGGNVTVTLNTPPAGKIYNIKKIAAGNTLTIDGNGATIDGSATKTVTTLNANTQIQFDGTNYVII